MTILIVLVVIDDSKIEKKIQILVSNPNDEEEVKIAIARALRIRPEDLILDDFKN